MSDLKMVNAHFVTGKVMEQFEHYWVLEAQRQVTDKDGNKKVFPDLVHIHGKKPNYKRAAIGGILKNFRVVIDGEEVTRTYLEAKEIRKAKASEFSNVGELVGDYFRFEVISKPGKKTFGAQLLRIGSHTVRAILFENPNYRACSRWNDALDLADAKREGSVIQFNGRLRVWNDRLEQVADTANILKAMPNPFAAASAAWEDDDDEDAVTAAFGSAPDDSGAIPDPV